MGSPEFAVPPLLALGADGYDIVAVYTQPDKPSGRGRGMSPSPVKRAAISLGLPVIQPPSLKKTPETILELTRLKPEIIIVAGYGQILPRAVLDLPRFGCLNLHPSLLPRHRGAAPVVATLLAGDTWAGTSVMLMEAGLDTGPVLARASVLIREEDTTGLLSGKLSRISSSLLLDVIPRWVRGQIEPQAQNEALATCFKTIQKEAGQIDWNLPATVIFRQIRAFQPWPGAYTSYRGKTLKITAGHVLDQVSVQPPGTVIAQPGSFAVVTGKGTLGITRVQLEGKQEMPSTEFLRGQPGMVGVHLPD